MRTDSKLSGSLHLIKTAMIEKKMTQAELADAASFEDDLFNVASLCTGDAEWHDGNGCDNASEP